MYVTGPSTVSPQSSSPELIVRNHQQCLCFLELSVQMNGSFRCWFMLFPEVAEMVETGKSNNKHESSPTRTRLKDHQNLPLAARTVVPGKEDRASPRSQRSLRTHSQPFPPALGCRITQYHHSSFICWEFSRGSSYLKIRRPGNKS